MRVPVIAPRKTGLLLTVQRTGAGREPVNINLDSMGGGK